MPNSNVLPHNLEAEQSILGCMLIDNELLGEILPSLTVDDFYVEAHKSIFGAMQSVYGRSVAVDLVTLCDELEHSAQMEIAGGIGYLTDLSKIVPSTANYMNYLDIVKRDGTLRKLIRGANAIIEDAGSSVDSQKSLSFAEKCVYDISAEGDRGGLTPIGEKFNDVIDKLQKAASGDDSFAGLKTGFKKLDDMTNGLKKGNMIVLAARPSCGKSTLAMNIVENIAINCGATCAMFALEMTKEELTLRTLCSISGVSHDDAIKGRLNEAAWKKIWLAKKKLDGAKIYFDDTSMTTTPEILSKCRRLKAKNGLDLIVIDHIQLMEVPKNSVRKSEGKQQEITEISRNLKMIAKELNVPVLALSQMNRALAQRKDTRPVLSDLRESGAIEQDADIVMFIHRPDRVASEAEKLSGNIPKNVAEIIVEKNRSGETGSFELLFKGENAKFVDLPPDYKAQFEVKRGRAEQSDDGDDYMPPIDDDSPLPDEPTPGDSTPSEVDTSGYNDIF